MGGAFFRARCALLVLQMLVIAGSQQSDSSDALQSGADTDDWHPKQRYSKTTAPLSMYHATAVSSAARLLAQGKKDEALSTCNSVLRFDTEHAPCLAMKAKVLAAKGQASAAIKSAQAAIDADPGWKDAYGILASLYSAQGQRNILARDHEAAYESFRKILLLDLDNEVLSSTLIASAYYGMGRALHAAGIEAEAIRNLERAVSLSPRSAEMYHKLAHVLVERGQKYGGDGAVLSVPEEDTLWTVLRRALKLQYSQHLWVHLLAANQRALEWSTHYTDMQALSKQLASELNHAYCSLPPPLLLSFPIPSQVLLACSRAGTLASFRGLPPPVTPQEARSVLPTTSPGDRRADRGGPGGGGGGAGGADGGGEPLMRVVYLSGVGLSGADPSSSLVQVSLCIYVYLRVSRCVYLRGVGLRGADPSCVCSVW
jgi:tetratricopeptide (TPR) repeat protein